MLALVLAAVMLFALSACSVSSSSTSTTTITTSTTDADGNTTTKTVTNEIGISAGTDGIQTRNETTTEETGEPGNDTAAEEAGEPGNETDWYEYFTEGAEGESDSGEAFCFAYDDPDDITCAMLVMVSADGSRCSVRNGEVYWDDELGSSVIHDQDIDVLVPFEISNSDEDDAFIMTFQDGDAITMFFVSQETIITDIQSVLSQYTFG